MRKVKIGERLVGEGEPCFIIAEAGVNHNGDLNLAKKLIDKASDAGADAVKFQTFSTGKLVTVNAPKAGYQFETTDSNESQYEMLKKLELSENDHIELIKYSQIKDLIFLSTPFDEFSVNLLEKLGVLAFKIGSGDITNLPLLEQIGTIGKPVIVSTGMADLEEVRDAVETLRKTGNENIVLLQCTSNYPARIEDTNLRVMETLRKEFEAAVGYSDHTLGITVALSAVAMGACIIEKHFTLDKNDKGPDHKASLEPDELKELVNQIRIVERAFGTSEKKPSKSELEIRNVVRKSIVASMNIPKGTLITKKMLTLKRPGNGIPSKELINVIGKKAKVDIKNEELIQKNMIGD